MAQTMRLICQNQKGVLLAVFALETHNSSGTNLDRHFFFVCKIRLV